MAKTIKYKEFFNNNISKTVCLIWLKFENLCLVCFSLCNRPTLISNRTTSRCLSQSLLHWYFANSLWIDVTSVSLSKPRCKNWQARPKAKCWGVWSLQLVKQCDSQGLKSSNFCRVIGESCDINMHMDQRFLYGSRVVFNPPLCGYVTLRKKWIKKLLRIYPHPKKWRFTTLNILMKQVSSQLHISIIVNPVVSDWWMMNKPTSKVLKSVKCYSSDVVKHNSSDFCHEWLVNHVTLIRGMC